MKINVVLLGQYRLAAICNEFLLEMPAGITAAAAVMHVRRTTNSTVIPEKPVIAVNHIQASLDDVLQDGDELALLPPVAGG